MKKIISKTNEGFALVTGLLVLVTISAVIAAVFNRSVTNSRQEKDARSGMEEFEVRSSIVNLVMQELKNYSWTPGQGVNDLLPTTAGQRFQDWYTDTFEGYNYTVSIADNSDEAGTQDFLADVDNQVYLRIAVTYPSGVRTTQILMSPGSPPTPPAEGPANVPGAVGVCYGFLNFITLLSMNSSSTLSGFDTTPDGFAGCATPGGCDVPGTTSDQFGLSSTSWFGSYFLPSYFGWASHSGKIIGEPGNLTGGSPPVDNDSFGKPTVQGCQNFDNIQTLADTMWAANDSRMNKYSRTFGTQTVNGNIVFGSESDPEVVYIKTGIFGRVKFTGEVEGTGILIADGNVEFEDTFRWNGLVINDANALGNVMNFEDEVEVYGAMVINRPILSAEIGSASMDLLFSPTDSANITYSSVVLDSILGNLDPNYVPPAGTAPGQMLTVASVQDL